MQKNWRYRRKTTFSNFWTDWCFEIKILFKFQILNFVVDALVRLVKIHRVIFVVIRLTECRYFDWLTIYWKMHNFQTNTISRGYLISQPACVPYYLLTHQQKHQPTTKTHEKAPCRWWLELGEQMATRKTFNYKYVTMIMNVNILNDLLNTQLTLVWIGWQVVRLKTGSGWQVNPLTHWESDVHRSDSAAAQTPVWIKPSWLSHSADKLHWPLKHSASAEQVAAFKTLLAHAPLSDDQ